MGIKYFCDKCGIEVRNSDNSFIDVNTRSLKTEHKAFLCNDCEKDFFNKISEIYKTFGFKKYRDC